MRHVLIAAAALAAGTILATSAASAQTYQAGGPQRIGNMCKVVTTINPDVESFGYYEPCGYQAVARAPARRGAPVQAAQFHGVYEAGGPERIGNMCKVVSTINPDVESFGYYAPCAR